MRKFNLRITAVFLLLVFTQSMGLRLMLHNKFHQPQHHSFPTPSPQSVQIVCDCLDEALMPSMQAPAVEVTVPEKEYTVTRQEQKVLLPSFSKIFRSLRAPPAV